MITTAEESYKAYADKYEEPRHHMEALLSASVMTMSIRPRLLYPLDDAGVRTVEDLIRLNISGLMEVPQIGVGAAQEIKGMLSRAGLDATDPTQIPLMELE